MIWIIWRQHRAELIGAVVILAGLGVLLLLHGLPMHEAYERDGVAACQAVMSSADPGSCAQTVSDFESTYDALPDQFTGWLPLAPVLVGMLIGAPLLAREYEQGTWQLAWTQGVTRTRWLATKLAVVLGMVLCASAVFAAGVSWWIAPVQPGEFEVGEFNQAVLVLPAYVVLAVAIGIVAGVVLRRTIAAAAIVLVGYLAVRIPVEFVLRPHYRTPLTTVDPAVAANGWVVEHGHDLGVDTLSRPVRYHPGDRFWEFQLIEAGILLAVTAVLLLIAWRLVLGRKGPVLGDHLDVVGSRWTPGPRRPARTPARG